MSGKLDRSSCVGTNKKSHENKNVKIVNINVAGSPNSVLIKVNNQRFRSLVDTGAELCLVNSKIFHALPNVAKLKKSDVHLQSVNGGSLEIEGKVDLTFQIGGLTMSHPFYVVQGMNRNFILGRDWLIQNGVRIYYDLGTMKINDVYVPLQEDYTHFLCITRCKINSIEATSRANLFSEI